jgi:hypothetical protein
LADGKYTVIASEIGIKYRSTWITVICAMVFTMLASLALRYGLNKANQREIGEKYMLDDVDKYEDQTDKQIPGFRYSL